MKCPNCRAEATVEHIQNNPECAAAIASLCARYRFSFKRKFTPGTGRGHKKQKPEADK